MDGTQLVEALTDMDIPLTQGDMKDRGEKVAKLFWSQSFRSRSRMILTDPKNITKESRLK